MNYFIAFSGKTVGRSARQQYVRRREIFSMDKPFDRRNTLCISRENGAVQRKKIRRRAYCRLAERTTK
jgi:hypothetical protein